MSRRDDRRGVASGRTIDRNRDRRSRDYVSEKDRRYEKSSSRRGYGVKRSRDDYHDERGSRRDGERRRRRHSDEKKDRQKDRSSGARHTKGGNGTTMKSAPPVPPRAPPNIFCYICGHPHWTIQCVRLKSQPEKFPLMRESGCWKCARRGHTASQCPNQAFKCGECGGVHGTKECAYGIPSVEWYEFYDEKSQRCFYTNPAETVKTWNPTFNERDTVLWYCKYCCLMIPQKYSECLKCHALRPQTKEVEEENTGTGEDSFSDREKSSSSSRSYSL